MNLPNDYSRCSNENCPLRMNCLRFLDKGEGLMWISDFKPVNGKCESQIKPNRNTGSFLKPDQKEHADKVFEFLTKNTAGDTAKDCECGKLQADKAELLEALKYANRMLKNSKDAMYDSDYIESLIQKHKK